MTSNYILPPGTKRVHRAAVNESCTLCCVLNLNQIRRARAYQEGSMSVWASCPIIEDSWLQKKTLMLLIKTVGIKIHTATWYQTSPPGILLMNCTPFVVHLIWSKSVGLELIRKDWCLDEQVVLSLRTPNYKKTLVLPDKNSERTLTWHCSITSPAPLSPLFLA